MDRCLEHHTENVKAGPRAVRGKRKKKANRRTAKERGATLGAGFMKTGRVRGGCGEERVCKWGKLGEWRPLSFIHPNKGRRLRPGGLGGGGEKKKKRGTSKQCHEKEG